MSAHDYAAQSDGPGSASPGPVGVAAVAAAGVGLVLLAGVLLGGLSSFLVSAWYGGPSSLQYSLVQLLGLVNGFVVLVLPVALGVFASFARLAPLRADFTLGHVIGRSLVAAASGIALSIVFSLIASGFTTLGMTSPLFGDTFPRGAAFGWDILSTLIGAVSSVFSSLDTVVPLVVLAGVLLWMWLRRRSPVEARRAEPNGV